MPSCTKWHVHTAPRIPPEFLRRHCSPSKKCFVTHLYVINEQCERSNPSKKCHFDHIPCYCLFFIAHTFKFNPFLNLFHKTGIKIRIVSILWQNKYWSIKILLSCTIWHELDFSFLLAWMGRYKKKSILATRCSKALWYRREWKGVTDLWTNRQTDRLTNSYRGAL